MIFWWRGGDWHSFSLDHLVGRTKKIATYLDVIPMHVNVHLHYCSIADAFAL
jgi:hypothetical protein